MLQIIHALNVLLPLCYGLSLILYGSYFSSKTKQTGRLASQVLLVGILIHAVYLVCRSIHFRHFPITNTFESFSMLALDIALIYIVIERIKREGNTGVFFVSIVFLFQVVSSMLVADTPGESELLSNPVFGVHATVTLLGLSALSVSCLYALMYLMLAKEMKRKRFGAIYDGLPSLETLEGMARYATVVGIVVLGLGILLGHFRATRALGFFFKADPKVLVTDLAWFAYAVGYLLVVRWKWQGLRICLFTFWAFIFLFSSLIAANFLANTFHSFA